MRYLLALLLAASSATAQTVTLPAAASGEPGAFVTITATADGKTVGWLSADKGLNLFPVSLLKDTKTVVVTSNKEGTYRVFAWTSKDDVQSLPAVCIVTIGTAPPGPGPGPAPGPGPFDKAGPFGAANGLYMLIVFDKVNEAKMLPAQQHVLYSAKMRNWLREHSGLESDGRISKWSVFDKDADVSHYGQKWVNAMGRPRKSLPWIVCQGPGGWYEGPLPATVDATIALLAKYSK